jgi:hypothetical protein
LETIIEEEELRECARFYTEDSVMVNQAAEETLNQEVDITYKEVVRLE